MREAERSVGWSFETQIEEGRPENIGSPFCDVRCACAPRVLYVHELLNALCQVFFQTQKRLVVTQFLHSLEFDLADSFTRVTQDFPGFF